MKGGCFLKAIGMFFLLMCLFAIFGGIYLLAKNLDLKSNGIETTGVFVEYHVSESEQTERDQARYRQTDLYYQPVFRYAVNGDSITAATHSSSQENMLFPGDQALLLYSPTDPTSIEFPDKINRNLLAGIVSLGVGLITLLILIYLIRHFRNSTKPV